MPLVIIIALLLYSTLSKNSTKRKKRLRITAIGLLLFFSNGFIINEAFKLWEKPVCLISEVPNATYGVVLSGFTSIQSDNDDRVYFNKGVDRMMHAVYLYKQHKIDTIVVTGGTVSVFNKKKTHTTEAERIEQVLVLCGIPKEKIVLETKARNTHENAKLTKAILKQDESILLITSAFHMRRSIGCFRKEGLDVFPFSTDFYSFPRKFSIPNLFIPSEVALMNWAKLIHEIEGYIIYDLVGYL